MFMSYMKTHAWICIVTIYIHTYPESLQLPNTFAPGDILVVKFHGKKSYRLYVVKVLYSEDNEYVVKFYKRVPSTWRFHETEKEAAFLPEDVLKKLQPNDNIQTSARFKDMINKLWVLGKSDLRIKFFS